MALEKAIMKHLPEELIESATAADVVEDLTELPDNMLWIRQTEGIDADEGIENSGGVSSYIFSLNMFLDTIESNAETIKNAYNNGEIRLYTVKVHALKTSARIIGATELSKAAEALENAGNQEDLEYIKAHNDEFLAEYELFRTKLAGLHADADDTKEPIPSGELEEAYEALGELVPQMDYDSVEMILEQVGGYRLPEKDDQIMSELAVLLKKLEWDAMEALLEDRN